MKTKLAFLTIGLLFICLAGKVNGMKPTTMISGQSLTELGQYSISLSDAPMQLGNETVKTYRLVYANSDSPILIGVKKTKKCMDFIIRSDSFEVEYVCNKHVFGVKRINKDYQTVNSAVINEMMNNAQFYSQRVISQYPKNEEELLGLIACYFPSLVKPKYLTKI